jgi:TrmH family RNA methyltransferase
MKKITSLQNPFVKQVVLWQEKSKERKKDGFVVIEGIKEIQKAVSADYEIYTVIFCPEKMAESQILEILPIHKISMTEWIEVNQEVFAKIAYREDIENFVVISRPKSHALSDVKLSSNPLLIVLESVEKPGNLGAILRTADAAGVDALLVCDPQTDIYNPNIIRSSIGCVFSKQIGVCSSEEAIEWLKNQGIKIFCTALTAAKFYHETDFTQASAIVLGTEAFGLTQKWLNASDANVIIPMSGQADSLNVSTSCAIVTFEAKRQRKFA